MSHNVKPVLMAAPAEGEDVEAAEEGDRGEEGGGEGRRERGVAGGEIVREKEEEERGIHGVLKEGGVCNNSRE
jgi:hypothetical protein